MRLFSEVCAFCGRRDVLVEVGAWVYCGRATPLVGLVLVAGVVLAAMVFPVVGGMTDSTDKPIAYLYRQFRIPVQSAQIAPAMTQTAHRPSSGATDVPVGAGS
jgi:hypothetical protein